MTGGESTRCPHCDEEVLVDWERSELEMRPQVLAVYCPECDYRHERRAPVGEPGSDADSTGDGCYWLAARIRCRVCELEEHAVFPLGTDTDALECAACGGLTSEAVEFHGPPPPVELDPGVVAELDALGRHLEGRSPDPPPLPDEEDLEPRTCAELVEELAGTYAPLKILGIFGHGCGNTIPMHLKPWHCPECVEAMVVAMRHALEVRAEVGKAAAEAAMDALLRERDEKSGGAS